MTSFTKLAFAAPHALPLARTGALHPGTVSRVPRRPRRAAPRATLSPPPPKTAPTGPTAPPRRARGRVTVDGDTLDTEPHHVALVATHTALAAATAAQAAAAVAAAGGGGAVEHIAAVAASYVAADFLVGVYHHALDNYGSAETPFFGYQIAAFQGHHSFPWTITTRTAANNLHRPAAAAIPLQLLTLLLLPAAAPARTGLAALLLFAAASQETHRQAHMARPAAWAAALQRAGLIVRPRAHGQHHRAPHKDNYCIVSGWCNAPLDAAGFFRAWEAVLLAACGARPLAWDMEPGLRDEALARVPAWVRTRAERREAESRAR